VQGRAEWQAAGPSRKKAAGKSNDAPTAPTTHVLRLGAAVRLTGRPRSRIYPVLGLDPVTESAYHVLLEHPSWTGPSWPGG